MPNRHSAGHRDANEPEIVDMLTRLGVRYRRAHEGDGYDLTLFIAPICLVEVKNPALPPSARRLTNCEKDMKEHCDEIGISYYVVETAEQLAEILYQRLAARA